MERNNKTAFLATRHVRFLCSNFHVFLSTDDEKFELSCINPGLILGPVLHGSTCTSMEVRKSVALTDWK